MQDMNSCLRCVSGLLEVAALFHEVHNFPSSCRIPPLRHAGHVSKYLKLPFVVQLFGFTLLLAERREGRRIAHLDEPNQPPLELLLFLSWKVLGSGFVPGI